MHLGSWDDRKLEGTRFYTVCMKSHKNMRKTYFLVKFLIVQITEQMSHFSLEI